MVLLVAISLYQGIVTRHYRVTTDRIPVDTSITIAHITDLHDVEYGTHQDRLIRKIQKQNPDIIVMTGDFIDNMVHYDNSVEFMERALEIAPCYYVLGNHEYWTWRVDDIVEIIKNTGVILIDNASTIVTIEDIDIEIFGVSDPDAVHYVDDYEYDSWDDMLAATYDSGCTSAYSVLLSHRPEKVDDYKKYDYDLVLTGHSHGGQVRIPLLINGLYVPNQGKFPKYAGGRYQYNKTIQIVNRGLHRSRQLPRIFNPPEIAIIEVMGEAIS